VEDDVGSRSEEILDLATQRRREKQVVDVEVEKTLIVVFALPGLAAGAGAAAVTGGLYGLPAAAIESIVAIDQITYVPGTPAWILGVVNVRGEIESVLDLKAVLGLGQAQVAPQSRLLIAQDGDLRSGLLVDEVVDIAALSSADIGPPPAPQEGGKGIYIAGQTQYAGRTLLILDLAEVFRRALETDGV